jgi:TusA-related sulfurtransferase
MTVPDVDKTMTAGDIGAGTDAAAPAADLEVDATGLACPLPILRAKKALAQLASGQMLKVITTDRNAIRDFQAFARQTGNVLVLQRENDGQGVHYLRRR